MEENFGFIKGDEILKLTIVELLALIKKIDIDTATEIVNDPDCIVTETLIDDVCVIRGYCNQVIDRARFCIKNKQENLFD